MLSAYYCWRPMLDGYECLQLLEQNGGFGNNGAQPPMQTHNVHNNAGKRTALPSPEQHFGTVPFSIDTAELIGAEIPLKKKNKHCCNIVTWN